MFKLILIIALVPLASSQVSADSCLSCGWISEEGTRALFKMNKQMEDSIANGGLVPLAGDPRTDKVLMSIAEDFVNIMENQKCDETLAGKLVAMLARLEEGENPTQKNSVPYHERPLVNTLEQHFVRFLGVCMAEAQQKAKLAKQNLSLSRAWETFVEFGQFLKKTTSESLMGEDENSIVKRAMQMMSSEQLYEKIRNKWGRFFNAEKDEGIACKQAFDKNLEDKLGWISRDLLSIFKPLLTLTGYKPDNFVNVPAEAKKGREIYAALEKAQTVMREDKQLADLVSLHLLMRKTFARSVDYCPRQ